MEVTVFGYPQVRICRAESAYRMNRFCTGSECISINARNRVSFYGETTRRSDIKLCFSQRSVKHEAIVSDKALSLILTPRTRSLQNVRLFVGLPLDTVSDCNTVNYTKAIAAGLRALKLLGVYGVELPVFWGVAEKESPGKYQWTGYLAIADMVKKMGLKLHVSLCFHGSKHSGIPLPDWVTHIGETEPGIYFTDRSGSQYKECLSFGLDDVPVLDGKTPMEVYRGFLESFKTAFSDFLGNTITGITIGLGPEGELRYPSHQTRKLSNGAGEFQCYDKRMLAALKHYAEANGTLLWGLCGPHDAPSYDQHPNSAPFFSDGGSWESEYGDFFLSWYSSLLVSHADRVLSLASSTFSGTGLPLCGKLPLLHQSHKLRSRPSELTAGFYCNGNHDRYEAVAETFANVSCRMILPGMDLSDQHQLPESFSSPESLLAHIKTRCKKHGVVVSGQNSSEPILGEFEKIIDNLKDGKAAIDLFTYQRMGALFFSPDHFHAFTEFVHNLSQFKLPDDDLRAEEEEETKTLNTSMQAARVFDSL